MTRTEHWLVYCAVACVSMAAGALPVLAQFASGAKEPTVLLKVEKGPYYANVPVDLFVEAEAFDPQASQPTCEAPTITNGTLSLVGATPNKRSFYSSINGRVTQSEEVSYSYRFQLVVPEATTCDIGAFTVTQGSVSRQSRGGRLSFEKIPEDPAVGIKLLLPEKPVFVGQAVEVVLEWTLDATIRNAVHDYDFVVPLFGAIDRFRFIDPEVQDRRPTLRFRTTAGEVALPYTTEEAPDRSGSVVLRAKRTAIPLRDGTLELPATLVVVDQVTRYERDIFGKRPSQVRKIAARDLPRRLVVMPVPTTGRPALFSGAIGLGYRLEVSADRTVVQVGDPVKLSLALSGDGLLEAAGAPRLDAPGNLSPSQFRVPGDRELGGQIEDGVKTFVASVRVLDEALREIPPIEYSWFNPDTARFESTRSQPIALRVRRGTMVTADDVVASSASSPSPSPSPTESADAEAGDGSTVERPRFTLTGAELSLEPNPSRVLARRGGGAGNLLSLVGLYCAPLILIALAWVKRWRAAIDPAIAERRKRLEQQVRMIEGASALPAREGAERVAQALRAVLAECPSLRNTDAESLIATCDAVVYAPTNTATGALPPEVRERSIAIARSAVQEVRA